MHAVTELIYPNPSSAPSHKTRQILMVRRRVSAVSNHEAPVRRRVSAVSNHEAPVPAAGASSFETLAAQAPQDEGITHDVTELICPNSSSAPTHKPWRRRRPSA